MKPATRSTKDTKRLHGTMNSEKNMGGYHHFYAIYRIFLLDFKIY